MHLASADGMIFPRPFPDERPIPAIAVKYHHVNASIDGQYAKTEVDQVFLNDAPFDIEGTYVFPLPDDASVSKFSMFAGGEELSGNILDRDEAKAVYEEIVRSLRDPALLEYMGSGMFKARVYPIPAARGGVPGEKRIKLGYEEMLSCDGGVCRYVYPLGTEKFSARPLESVLVTVGIRSQKPIKAVYSPSHEVSVRRVNDRSVEVSFEAGGVLPDKDFQLYYSFSEEDFGVSLLVNKAAGEDGYFMLLLAPGFSEDRRTMPKDIVFVVDSSGSMSGEKIQQAKDALKYCISNLNDGDSFGVVSFESVVEEFSPSLLPASADNRKSAAAFVDGIGSGGGTNINEALLSALSMLEGGEDPDLVVFLTDGLPTVGVTESERIIANVAEANNGTRVFVFGVGYDVDTHLLDTLSEESGGASEYVEPEEDIEVKVSSLYTKVRNPVLSDIKVEYSGVKVKDSYPRQLPDLFRGSQLAVFGRYSGGGAAAIKLSGKVSGRIESFTYEVKFPESESDNSFIPRLWASRKIGYLLDEIRLSGESDEVVDEIINLSLRYGIMTPYTSFLVDLDTEGGAPVRMEEARDMMHADFTSGAAFWAPTGAGAVQSAKNVQDLKESDVYSQGHERVKVVDGKTFYLRDGVWVDNDYASGVESTEIEFGGEAYFQLARDFPEVGKFLSLGEKVRFCVGGGCFSIGEVGEEDSEVSVPTSMPDRGVSTSVPGNVGSSAPSVFYQTVLIMASIIFVSAVVLYVGRRGN
jgi:Ca-activated chloride channel family protein